MFADMSAVTMLCSSTAAAVEAMNSFRPAIAACARPIAAILPAPGTKNEKRESPKATGKRLPRFVGQREPRDAGTGFRNFSRQRLWADNCKLYRFI
jgi:hypothetical protein